MCTMCMLMGGIVNAESRLNLKQINNETRINKVNKKGNIIIMNDATFEGGDDIHQVICTCPICRGW